MDVASKRVVQRFATERYPYGVAVAPDGRVFVSAWGGNTVALFRPNADGNLQADGQLRVARHPSALALSSDGSRLFVASGSTDRIAVVDTRAKRVIAELSDAPPAGPREGSTPNALALDATGTRLYVAEADNNAIGIFDLSPATSGVATATGRDSLAGRVPVEWYPTAVIAAGDTLLVANGKGRGTAPNRDYPHPGTGVHTTRPQTYTLGQLNGSVLAAPVARASGPDLESLTRRVERANGWREVTRDATYPPFEHVIYIIKENRTYDQVFGDMTQGDGDTSLVFFPRANSPNHHALADRFGLFDRFFVNAEVSPDGHNWSMAAYATDYLEKTVPVELFRARADVRLRGDEPRPRPIRRGRRGRLRAGERLLVGPRAAKGTDVPELRRVRDPGTGRTLTRRCPRDTAASSHSWRRTRTAISRRST